MQDTILKFSTEELSVLNDLNFFLLKHSVTRKIVELFGEMEAEYKVLLAEYSIDVPHLNTSSGKIFRGENYNQFPYILLDCPRLFNKETVFAFRTMMWWGNEFSFTFHLQGLAFERYKGSLLKNVDQLFSEDIYFCVNDNPWQYHFNKENYLPFTLENIDTFSKEMNQKNFVKLSRRVPLSDYSAVKEKGKETLRLFFSLLK